MTFWSGPPLRYGIAVAAVVLLVAMAPFGPVLDVHHQLAEADQDSHQHSDFDLCQWVQHHGTSAPALHVLDLGRPLEPGARTPELAALRLSSGAPSSHPSPRGPPLFS